MKFKMSSAVSLQTADPEQAFSFYTKVLGFPSLDEGDARGVDVAPLTMYVGSRQYCDGLLMELIVDDVEAARGHLVENGCTVVHWDGAGKACIIEDPFGIRFNLWQDN